MGGMAVVSIMLLRAWICHLRQLTHLASRVGWSSFHYLTFALLGESVPLLIPYCTCKARRRHRMRLWNSGTYHFRLQAAHKSTGQFHTVCLKEKNWSDLHFLDHRQETYGPPHAAGLQLTSCLSSGHSGRSQCELEFRNI